MHASSQRFDRFSIFLHWLTAVLVAIAFTYGLGGSEARVYLPARDGVRSLHETLGMAVLGISIIRLIWAAFRPARTPIDLPAWMRLASRVAQIALYALLFVVPVSAILGVWWEGHQVVLLGGVALPNLLPQSHDLGVLISEIHTVLGDLIIWIAGLHAIAAIYHHYWRKDSVLKSMLPAWIFPTRE